MRLVRHQNNIKNASPSKLASAFFDIILVVLNNYKSIMVIHKNLSPAISAGLRFDMVFVADMRLRHEAKIRG